MTIRNKDLYELCDRLNDKDKKAAFDFMRTLLKRTENRRLLEESIEHLEIDEDELSEEELKQLESDGGYITWEEAKKKYGISGDL